MPTREIHFQFTSVDFDAEHEADIIEAICEGFVRANEIMILADPDFFPNDLDDLQYHPPKSCPSKKGVYGCQPVKGGVALLQRGAGTCIDLACLLCALLRVKHGDGGAKVVIYPQNNKQGLYHAVVESGSGTIYDPERMQGDRNAH
jgi:hypothetical protein